MNKSYEIATMELGPMENFIYLITDVDSRQAAVVDPAWEPDKIIEYASANDIQITDILLTHSHHDHINGVEEVLNKYDSKQIRKLEKISDGLSKPVVIGEVQKNVKMN